MKINFIKILKILGIACVVVIISLILLIKFILFSLSVPLAVVNEPSQYEKVLKKIIRKEKITFLPKTIPAEATDVQLFAYYDNAERECIVLKFKINKEYIEKELSRNEFLNADDPSGKKQDIYNVPNDNGRISIDGFTFYVLKDNENEAYYEQYFPYFTAIGVDRNLEHIIYYYILPD